MIKLIKHTAKVTLLAVLLMMLFTTSISASGEVEWRHIATINFDEHTEGNISSSYLPEITKNFSAEVNNGSLDVASDNLCWWQMNNDSSTNAAGNTHDITLVNGVKIQYVETPVDSEYGTFNYTGAAGDSGTYYTSSIDGKKALKMLTYHCTANNKTRNNYYRFNIPQDKFSSNDNKFDVEIEIYIEDYVSPKKYVSFQYCGTDGNTKTVKLDKAEIEDGIEGNWYTWKFTIENADFTRKIYSNSAKTADPGSFYIRQPFYTETTLAETYIHSISIKKSSSLSLEFTDRNKTVIYPISNESFYGNTSLSFDMILPKDELYSSEVFYNEGSNAMMVGLADADKKDIATLLIESDELGQNIYSISENSEGTKENNLLYSGDILGETLNYTITLDRREKTYTVAIKKEDGSYLLEETEPFSINNLSSVGSELIGKFISIKHNPRSIAMLSRFDNISLYVQDDIEYINCREDLNSVELEISQDNLVNEDFFLETEGPLFGNTITWSSDNTDVLVINTETNTAEVICGTEKVDVILTAKIETQSLVVTREFKITVDEHSDYKKARQDAEDISLTVSEDVGIKGNFELPLNSQNGTITWTSDNPAIIINGNVAEVTRTAMEEYVVLTARVTVGEFFYDREYILTVSSLAGVFSNVSDVENSVIAVEENGVIKATLKVKYPAKTGTLNFVAVSVNSSTGEIVNRAVDTEVITGQNKYSTITFEIENFSKGGADTVEYYLIDDNFVSYENTAPLAVTELKASDKVKGVSLQWQIPHDDNNALDHYKIYRNGELIGSSKTNEYFDASAAKGENYEYKVLAVDTTDNESDTAAVDAASTQEMYYISYDKYGRGDKVYMNGMEWQPFLTEGENDSYAFIEEVTDANGETCYAARKPAPIIENKYHWIHCKTNKSYINSTHNELVIEITYLDVTRNSGINMTYNSETAERDDVTVVPANPNGTYEWKTGVVRVNDAKFRNATTFSGCDFGFSCGFDEMFIKEVRIIQAELYD